MPIALAAFATATVRVQASITLTAVPLATHAPGAPDTNNECRAISPDGQYVVGIQYSNPPPTATYPMTYRTNFNAAFLYDVVSNVLRCDIIDSTPSSFAGTMTGVGYRTYSGTQELVISGGNNGDNADWMTSDGGGTWGAKRRDTGLLSTPVAVLANAVAGTETDVFYQVVMNQPSGDWGLRVGKFSGAWPMTPVWDNKQVPSGTKCAFWGVSATGRAVGFRNGVAGIPSNEAGTYIGDWNGSGAPTMWHFTALDGTVRGQAFAVSADGTIVFGFSPVLDPFTYPGNWPFKALVGAATPSGGSTTNGLSVQQMPTYPDTAGSTSEAIPYGCTRDGNFAVGMNYRGTEKAVVWDTSDADTTKWTVMDLTQLAQLQGKMDIFLRLNRGYSVASNAAGNLVVAGIGVTTNLATRGFVMTLPLPLAPALTISNSGGGLTVSYLGFGNTTNVLEYTTNVDLPHNWTPLDTNTSGSITTYLDAAPPDQQRFYRVRIQ